MMVKADVAVTSALAANINCHYYSQASVTVTMGNFCPATAWLEKVGTAWPVRPNGYTAAPQMSL